MKNLRNKNHPPEENLVSANLLSSWDIIRAVYDNLDVLKNVSDEIDQGGLVSPLTVKGDLWGYGTANTRIPVGVDGDVLWADSTAVAGVSWIDLTTLTGDVSKVGTPVDNQVSIWTGDGTIEGTASFTWDGTTVNIGGDLTLTGTVDGRDVAVDGARLDTMEDGAQANTVSKVGIPVDNEIGVWTGDGAIEGASGATWNGSSLNITGDIVVSGTVDGRDVAADGTKLDGIETGATADQTDAEIATAYQTQVPLISQAAAEAGTATGIESWSAERVSQAIAALGGSGGIVWETRQTDWADAANNEGAVFESLVANTTAFLPTAAVGVVCWVFNNDPTYNVLVQTAIGGKIAKLGADLNEVLTLAPGEGGCFVCSDAGSPNYWEAVLFNQSTGGGGGGMTVVSTKTGNYTASSNEVVPVDSTGGSFTITYPASPSGQDRVIVIDVGKACTDFPVTVARNGNTIDGVAEDFVIDQTHGRIDSVFDGTSDWQLHVIGVSGVASKMRTVRTVIEKITNVTAGEFDFNNIPSGYDRLIIKGHTRGDVTAFAESIYLFMNEELTVGDYHYQALGAINGAEYTPEGSTPQIGSCPADSAAAGLIAAHEIIIEDPDGSNTKLATGHFNSYRQSDEMYSGIYYLASAMTAAVTRLRVRTDNHATDQLTGELILYGEKDEEIGGGGGVVGELKQFLIEEIDNTVAGEYDFNNIPSGYDRLIIKGMLRGDVTAQWDVVNLYFNTDLTDANYLYQQSAGTNGTASMTESATARAAVVAAASAEADQFTQVEFVIEQPNSAHKKTALTKFGGFGYIAAADAYVGNGVLTSDVTAAITRLRVRTDNNPTDELFGKMFLYGEKVV